MSRTYRFRPGRMPAGLVHAIVIELGFDLRCSGSWRSHNRPDDCASGQWRYSWQSRAGAVSDAAFAASLRRRGWSEAGIRAWRAPVCACCGVHNGFGWERRIETRAARRIAKVQVGIGREDHIRPRPRHVCDGH